METYNSKFQNKGMEEHLLNYNKQIKKKFIQNNQISYMAISVDKVCMIYLHTCYHNI